MSKNDDPSAATVGREIDIVIVGAGFSGLYALYRMRESGFRVALLEKADEVGGTWYWNRYPGARCDVESFDYSFSFSPELDQEWDWSERFATQPEILRYLVYVADRFDLRRDIRFGTTVTGAVYDESAARWQVRHTAGPEIAAQFLIMATGPLSVPIVPELPGLSEFRGRVLHTSDWPDEPVSFEGRAVAVIGTGSSGVQAIPLIAQQAGSLHVLQRTANYVVPAHNRVIDTQRLAEVKASYPQRRAQARSMSSAYIKEVATRSALEVDLEEREREYERHWRNGGPTINSAFTDIKTDERANRTLADFLHAKIRAIVADPQVAEALIPPGYPVGAKRICVGTDYYETFNRDTVTLVDLREEPLIAAGPTGLETSRRLIEVDDIVLATGFDAMTGALTRMDIRGTGGRALSGAWAQGPVNYLGMAVQGFPNMFFLGGPGSPSVLANVPPGSEAQINWIERCLTWMRAEGKAGIEATAEAQQQWIDHVNDLADRTLFRKAKSWYLGANVPGKANVFMPYAGGFPRYVNLCEEVAEDGYRGFRLTEASRP